MQSVHIVMGNLFIFILLSIAIYLLPKGIYSAENSVYVSHLFSPALKVLKVPKAHCSKVRHLRVVQNVLEDLKLEVVMRRCMIHKTTDLLEISLQRGPQGIW